MRILSIAACVLLFTQTLNAQEVKKREWLEFFAGDWVRTTAHWTKEQGKVEDKAFWTCRLSPDGKSAFSQGTWEGTGNSWALLSKFNDEHFHHETGLASEGDQWSIAFDLAEENVLRGPVKGSLNGKPASGFIALTRTGPDSYTATGEVKNEEGEVVLRVNAQNVRRNSQPRSAETTAEQRTKAMKLATSLFVGRWKRVDPNGSGMEHEVTASPNGAALVWHAEEQTRLIGWNPEEECLEILVFGNQGERSTAFLKQVGDEPRFDVTVVDIAPDATRQRWKAELTFVNPNRWTFKGVLADGTEVFAENERMEANER